MFYGSLAFVFEVMVYIGLGLPLVNLLLGLISGGHDMDTDMDVDIDIDADLSGDISVDGDFSVDADSLSDFSGDVDVSGPDIAGGILKGFLLFFNMYCFCLALVIQGAVGIFALTNFKGITCTIVVLAGTAFAITAYALLYRLVVLPLKRNKSEALKVQSLLYSHAKVTFRILRDSPGKIQTQDGMGAVISFRAELDPDICKVDRIDEAEEVIITDIDKAQDLCYVTKMQDNIYKEVSKLK